MILSNQQLNQLSELALNAVTLAGKYINQFDRTQLTTEFKNSGSSRSSQVVTEVDLHCQDIIITQLQASCELFDIALLSEENCAEIAINEHPRLDKAYFWCIDPLDGTLPFIEGREGYAVSVALVNKQGQSQLSAIYLPATHDYFHTLFNEQAKRVVFRNNKPFMNNQADHHNLNFYCDQSFLSNKAYPRLIEKLNKLLIAFNLQQLNVTSEHGAVVNALLVLENSPAIYIKLPKPQEGGGALWDYSGTSCIAEAVEAWVSDIHGLPLALNQADSYYMNKKGVIYASNEKLAKAVIDLCQAL
ncbi:MAG: inositol-1-monophosphatase [Psychromonas sp.]|nr:inositol-1-monophosphatase [Psychromonas sp.]